MWIRDLAKTKKRDALLMNENTRPEEVDVLIGMRVRNRRKELGLTQTDLGNAVGLTFQQIQKYERGANRIGASRVFEFSQILGISIADLFSDIEGNAADRQREILPDRHGTVGDFNRKETYDLAFAFTKIRAPKVRTDLLSLIRRIADDELETND